MRALTLKLPHALWEALEARARESGATIHHLARAALADYLGQEHSTLFQVSTSGAVVEGIYKGAVTVGELKRHGDFGLGTFEGLDGEMIALEGHFFQARSDGQVVPAPEQALSPFAVLTWFQAGKQIELEHCQNLGAITAALDSMRESDNVFYAIRVDGAFSHVHTRVMCKTDEGTPLVVAAAHQPEFEFRDLSGTLVGFWAPEYVKTLEVPGYHLHFISDDRRAGGHLLQCAGANLKIRLQQVSEMHLALPANQEFLRADLTHDPGADLKQAEG